MRFARLHAALILASGSPTRFQIDAYNGGKLRVEGFDLPVIVDLAGLVAAASIPILIDHVNTVETTFGQVRELVNDGRELKLAGQITGASEKARQVVASARAGHRWQASIGAAVDESVLQTIAAGQSVHVNGQTFTGPAYVSRRTELRETSVLAMGADGSTKLTLAAKAAQMKGKIMNFEEWAESMGFDLASLSDDAKAYLTLQFEAERDGPAKTSSTVAASVVTNLRATAASESRRIAEINAKCAGHPRIAATAIEKGWTPVEAELAVMKTQRPSAPSAHARSDGPSHEKILVASLAMTAGGSDKFLAKSLGDDVVDAASRQEHRGATFHTVMHSVIRAAGMNPPSHRVTDAYIRAAFQASRILEASGPTPFSLPGILSSSANKLLLEGFATVKTTWQEFCAVNNLENFKPHKRYRMIMKGEFEEVTKGGKIKELRLGEEDYENQLKTFAKMVILDRTDLINDDMNVFDTLPKGIGRMGNMRLEKEVYRLLLANADSFFSVGNDNIKTGGGSALAISSLTAARTLFVNRTDGNGDPIMLAPEVLLVPPSLSETADLLTHDTQVIAVGVGNSAATVPNGNPHGGKFTPYDAPWLENEQLTGHSAKGWYLIARPQGTSGLIEVGFLNNQRTPTIENGECDFDTLGVALRGFWDWGVAFQDGRYGVFSAGE